VTAATPADAASAADPASASEAPGRAGVPDADSRARTHLANERTFLAWFRTGLTLIALGLAAAQFLSHDVVPGIPVVRIMSSVLAISGVFLVLVGARRYLDGRTHIDEASFRPAHMSILLTTGAAVITGVLAIAFVWLLREV
jgi:putative membrane protein